MNKGMNKEIKEDEIEKFLNELFEEIYRNYVNNGILYRSKL